MSWRDCSQCQGFHDIYMVKNDVWKSVVTPEETSIFLCFFCLQARLGRQLTPDDFDFTIVCNIPILFGLQMGKASMRAKQEADRQSREK